MEERQIIKSSSMGLLLQKTKIKKKKKQKGEGEGELMCQEELTGILGQLEKYMGIG